MKIIHDFGIFGGKKIFANIFLASLILVGIFCGTKICSKNIVIVFSATVFSAMQPLYYFKMFKVKKICMGFFGV